MLTSSGVPNFACIEGFQKRKQAKMCRNCRLEMTKMSYKQIRLWTSSSLQRMKGNPAKCLVLIQGSIMKLQEYFLPPFTRQHCHGFRWKKPQKASCFSGQSCPEGAIFTHYSTWATTRWYQGAPRPDCINFDTHFLKTCKWHSLSSLIRDSNMFLLFLSGPLQFYPHNYNHRSIPIFLINRRHCHSHLLQFLQHCQQVHAHHCVPFAERESMA